MQTESVIVCTWTPGGPFCPLPKETKERLRLSPSSYLSGHLGVHICLYLDTFESAVVQHVVYDGEAAASYLVDDLSPSAHHDQNTKGYFDERHERQNIAVSARARLIAVCFVPVTYTLDFSSDSVCTGFKRLTEHHTCAGRCYWKCKDPLWKWCLCCLQRSLNTEGNKIQPQ